MQNMSQFFQRILTQWMNEFMVNKLASNPFFQRAVVKTVDGTKGAIDKAAKHGAAAAARAQHGTKQAGGIFNEVKQQLMEDLKRQPKK